MTSLVVTEKPFVHNTNGLGNTSDLTTGSQPEKLGLKNKWDFPAVLSLSLSVPSPRLGSLLQVVHILKLSRLPPGYAASWLE